MEMEHYRSDRCDIWPLFLLLDQCAQPTIRSKVHLGPGMVPREFNPAARHGRLNAPAFDIHVEDRVFTCVDLFDPSILCLAYLSSGENLGGCGILVGELQTGQFS